MASMTRSEILKPEDFEAIREAVMETPRGRWFLEQYAERIRGAESTAMIEGMRRLESAVAENHGTLMTVLSRALANAEAKPAPAPAPAASPELAPRHMKFFRQDEEIFEPAPQATIAAVPETPKPAPKPEAPKGAKVIIRRAETVSMETIPEMPAPAPQPAVAAPEPPAAAVPVQAAAPEPAAPPAEATPAADAQPKRRIVIIRHKPGEDIDVPLQQDIAKAS